MIVFDLNCGHGHVFEAWFGSSADYEAQRERGLIACPVCDDTRVQKAPMAPAVGLKGNQRSTTGPTAPATHAALPSSGDHPDAQQVMSALKEAVEKNCDYVGDRFADEARAIHLGERPATRGIYGEATLEDAKALSDEGIEIAPLPFRPRARADA